VVIRWATTWGALGISLVVLGSVDAAQAGNTRATPPVRTVPPPAASSNTLEPDDLPGPPPEVVKPAVKLDVPAVPRFDLPVSEPGFHSPRKLRVHGKPMLGTEIKVRGYVTSIYDCAMELANANPKATRAQIVSAIDKDPSLCERPMFFLGDAKATSRDASIWVVDVPRPPGSADRGRPAKTQRIAPVPKFAVGDYVVVTGTWAIQSPYAEHNTDGLLVYKALEHAVAPAADEPGSAKQELEMEIQIDSETAPAMRKIVDDNTRNASVDHLNACTKAIAARQYDAAIAECQAATTTWEGNHLAWYAWASAHMARSEWEQATAAVEHAVALRPDQGMYQLYYGISLYEAERQKAREDQANKDHKKPKEVSIDLSVLRLDAARDALLRATELAPDLWRAHYYLGRVYRDLDDAKRAAKQFTQTIKTHPAYRFGYIALIELYRKWDYLDQALAVALLGTANVPAAETAELWFEVGMAYDAKHADDKAIEAFSKAVTGKPDDVSSKFQRGQIYFRRGDLDNAKHDLEDVVKSADPLAGAARQLATQLLGQIATSSREPSSRGLTERGCRTICRRPVFTWRSSARSRAE
jgi:tetratricopeptide (TPR) repeat protein